MATNETIREAQDFCNQIMAAAELAKVSKELTAIAQHTGSLIMQRSLFAQAPFRLKVSLPETSEAYTVCDDKIINPQPSSFNADEVRNIGQHGVEFYDRESDTWLRIRGFDFEVSPVFTDAPATET